MTYEFARKVEGSGVAINCLHPGIIRTNIGKNMPWYFRWTQLFSRSPKHGAETSIYLASSPEVEGVSGKYYRNRKEAKSSSDTYNETYAKKIWAICSKLTKIEV